MKHLLSGTLAALLCLSVLTLPGCVRHRVLRGQGKTVTMTEALHDGFCALTVKDIRFHHSDCIKLTVDPALDDTVAVSAPQNLLDTLTLTVEDGEITLKGDRALRYAETVTITVGTELTALHLAGGAELDLTLPTVERFSLRIDGAADGDIDFGTLASLDAVVNGAADLEFSGSADYAEITVNGAASLDAEALHCVDCNVSVNGAGSCTVWVSGALDVTVNGAGAVTYGGNPTNVKPTINGLGSISPIRED